MGANLNPTRALANLTYEPHRIGIYGIDMRELPRFLRFCHHRTAHTLKNSTASLFRFPMQLRFSWCAHGGSVRKLETDLPSPPANLGFRFELIALALPVSYARSRAHTHTLYTCRDYV